MDMQVMCSNNRSVVIDSNLLEEMISVNKIKMFMRSDGWAMVGIAHTRGEGGNYAGPDRRSMFAMMPDADYRIVTG